MEEEIKKQADRLANAIIITFTCIVVCVYIAVALTTYNVGQRIEHTNQLILNLETRINK